MHICVHVCTQDCVHDCIGDSVGAPQDFAINQIGAFLATLLIIQIWYHVMNRLYCTRQQANKKCQNRLLGVKIQKMLSFNAITFTYPTDTIPALKHVSCAVAKGSTLAILGANGSGKSTLARLANALLIPDSGTVSIIADAADNPVNNPVDYSVGDALHNSADVAVFDAFAGAAAKAAVIKTTEEKTETHVSVMTNDVADAADITNYESIRRHVALVMQDPDDQILTTSVKDEVAFGPQNLCVPADEIEKRVAQALVSVGFTTEDFGKRDPNSLSGGQKQRLVIASCLSMQPDYLVLDEPTSMLDTTAASEVQKALAVLSASGHGLLLVTHSLDEALRADEVVVLQNGQVAFSGSSKKLWELYLQNTQEFKSLAISVSPLLQLAHQLSSFGLSINTKQLSPAGLTNAILRGANAIATSKIDAANRDLSHTGAKQTNMSQHASHLHCCNDKQHEVKIFNVEKTSVYGAKCHSEALSSLTNNNGALEQRETLDIKASDSGDTKEREALLNITKSNNSDGFKQREVLLNIKNVSFAYSEAGSKKVDVSKKVLNNVNLKIAAGELHLLVGVNGSGKSTLLRIAAGLLPPSCGSVTLCDSGIAPLPGDIGLVFQNPEDQLFATTVFDDIAFGLRNTGRGNDAALLREYVNDALEDVALSPSDFSSRSPFTLSGGQARRVAIATVLAMRQRVVLFDEPTSGLDSHGVAQIVGMLMKLRASGVAVVLVSHDIDAFLPLADKVSVLKHGRVTFSGSAAELVASAFTLVDAGLKLPALLDFQQRMGMSPNEYSLDVATVASRALRINSRYHAVRAGL
jgi:energy-coupling factor transport system ATP-binding protein